MRVSGYIQRYGDDIAVLFLRHPKRAAKGPYGASYEWCGIDMPGWDIPRFVPPEVIAQTIQEADVPHPEAGVPHPPELLSYSGEWRDVSQWEDAMAYLVAVRKLRASIRGW